MTDLRKAAEDLLEVVEAAIKAGDWKVDGACDLDLAIVRLRQALAQPEQGRLREITREFVGVKEDGSERWVETEYRIVTNREWAGLTDEERFKIARDTRPYVADTMRAHEEELKRRNT